MKYSKKQGWDKVWIATTEEMTNSKKEYVAYMYDTEEEENFLLFEEGTSSINQFINLTYYCS